MDPDEKAKGAQDVPEPPIASRFAPVLPNRHPNVAVSPAALVARAAVRNTPVVRLGVDQVLTRGRERGHHPRRSLTASHHDFIGGRRSVTPTPAAAAPAPTAATSVVATTR